MESDTRLGACIANKHEDDHCTALETIQCPYIQACVKAKCLQALDGGYLLLLAIEAARGKKLDKTTEQVNHPPCLQSPCYAKALVPDHIKLIYDALCADIYGVWIPASGEPGCFPGAQGRAQFGTEPWPVIKTQVMVPLGCSCHVCRHLFTSIAGDCGCSSISADVSSDGAIGKCLDVRRLSQYLTIIRHYWSYV